jgi:hypothetical protein
MTRAPGPSLPSSAQANEMVRRHERAQCRCAVSVRSVGAHGRQVASKGPGDAADEETLRSLKLTHETRKYTGKGREWRAKKLRVGDLHA